MNLIGLYNRMVLLTLILGIASYTVAAPAPLLALFAIPAAWVGWRLSGHIGTEGSAARLPTIVVNVLLLAAVAFAVYRAANEGFTVSHVAELVVFIQLIKLGDRRGPRDDAQILYLSVFLAIAAMLTSNTLWVGAVLAIFLPVLVAAVMLFQLHKGGVVAGVRAQVADKPGAHAMPFGKHFRRTVGFGAVGTLVAAFAIFVIMPRGIGENTLGRWGNPQQRSVTGFTDQVNLGSRGVISTSPTVVLDLVVRDYNPDGSSLPLGGMEAVHYLRGAVLDTYDNGRWLPSRGEHKEIQSGVEIIAGERYTIAQLGGPLIEQTVTLRNTPSTSPEAARRSGRGGEPSTRLFAMWRPVRVQVQRRSVLAIHNVDGIFERWGEGGPMTYTVWSTTADPRPLTALQHEIFPGTDGGYAVEPRVERRTPASFDSGPIRELASEILRGAGISPDPTVRPVSDDSRGARAIQDYLRANFEYTLDEQYVPPDAHPIEHFLFETRRGHCEYYASAMTAMCRSVGINARIITGYVAAEFNQASGHYTVRESNAHAWVEAEAGPNRWRRFDPTPQSDLVRLHRPQRTVLGRIRQMLDAVEFAWNTSIVGFDAGQRERLLRTSRVRDSQFIQRLDGMATSMPLASSRSSGGMIARLAIVFVILAVPAAGLFMLLRWIRMRWQRVSGRRAGRRRRDQGADPAFFQAYLAALSRRGHPKPSWSPPLAHAQALPTRELAAPAADVARLYYEARFAGRRLSESELAEAERLIEELAAVPAEK